MRPSTTDGLNCAKYNEGATMSISSSYSAGQEVHVYNINDHSPSRIDCRITRVTKDTLYARVIGAVPAVEQSGSAVALGEVFGIAVNDENVTDNEEMWRLSDYDKQLLLASRDHIFDDFLDHRYGHSN